MGFQGIGRYFYNYRVNKDRIEFLLFGQLPFMNITLTKDVIVAEVPIKSTLFPDFSTLRLGNKVSGRVVEIKREHGFFKRILITPDDTDAFIADINRIREHNLKK
jgi:hypothetical protein